MSRTDLLLCLAMAGECRDTDTGRRLVRVSRYSQLPAAALGLQPGESRPPEESAIALATRVA